jgi:predicted DNA-binding protein (UPF0251 family)
MQAETRISVPLAVDELEALRLSAQRNLRDPQKQARHLLRLGLQQDGSLTCAASNCRDKLNTAPEPEAAHG